MFNFQSLRSGDIVYSVSVKLSSKIQLLWLQLVKIDNIADGNKQNCQPFICGVHYSSDLKLVIG